MKTDELHDVWLRDRAGESISAAERSALDEAMRQNAPFRTRLSEDRWVDGSLRAMGRSERDGEAFTQTTIRRLQHEQSGARFVADTVRRARELSSRPAEKALRQRSGWRWAAALAASLAGLAAGSLIYRSIISPPPPGTANIAQHNGHSEWRVAGHIAEILGTVEVRVGDEATSVAATPGMALFEGSRVLTGDGDSGCRLALARGDVVVTVSGDSELTLKAGGADRQYDSEVNLTRGELQAEVRRKGTRFAVVSVAGKAEAIGTEFKVKLQEQTEEKDPTMNKTQMSMLTTVLSGVVLISNPFGTMTARAGDAVAVTPAIAPELATNALAPRTRTDPAAVIITPRTWNARMAFGELHRKGGPRVVLLDETGQESFINENAKSMFVKGVGMCDGSVRGLFIDMPSFCVPVALCLLVPPELRFVPVEGRKLIEAVAATRRLKTVWSRDGRVAVLYKGVPDTEVDVLRKDLASADADVRRNAAWRAGWMRDARVVPLLVKAAKDEDTRTARQAVEGLRRLKWTAVVALDETAIDLLAAELDLSAEKDAPNRSAAVGALAYASGEQRLTLLEKALADKDTGVRYSAAKALGYVGGDRAVVLLEKALAEEKGVHPTSGQPLWIGVVESLARLCGEKEWAIIEKKLALGDLKSRRRAFGVALADGDKAPLALLEKACADQDVNIRKNAVQALRRVGGDQALALIEKALGDWSDHGSVHYEAVRALGQVGGEKALALLEKVLNAGGNDRISAAYALAHVGGDQALALLEKADGKAAAYALRNYGGDKALALIEKALADQNEYAREYATVALGTFGDEKALALIEKTIDDTKNVGYRPGIECADAACGAAEALIGYMDSDKGMALIEKTLRNPKPGVGRAAAIAVFHAVGDAQALPLIEKAYAGGEVLKDAEMRYAAVMALGRIGPHKALALLEKAVADPNVNVREYADEALKCVDGEKELTHLLTTPSAAARRLVVENLGKLGGGKARALLLGRLAVEKDKNVLASIESRLRMDFPDDPAVEKALKDYEASER
jgi:HEAT repeat protein